MRTEQEIMKKAQRCLKKYRLWITVVSIIVIALYVLITFTFDNGWISFLLVPIALLIMFFGSVICFKKCVLSLVTKEMDPDTFLKMFDIEKMDATSGTWQLLGEYYAGNYQNVIKLCNLKMKNEKLVQKHQYMYLCNLANVYFDIGDNEALKSICEKFEDSLAKEKPNRSAAIRSSYPIMVFYSSYLGKNTEACKNYLDRPIKDEVTKYRRMFLKAKLVYEDGDIEKARALYSEIAEKAASINYGKLASTVLANMDNMSAEESKAEGAPALLMEIDPEDNGFGVLRICHKSKRPVWIVLGILMAVFIVSSVVEYVIAERYIEKVDEYNEKREEYFEDIHSLVSRRYDDVEVYDAVDLYYEENIVDTVFVCKADDNILVGISFVYRTTDKLGYKEMATIPIKNLTVPESTVTHRTYNAVTSAYEINSCFYTSKNNIPKYYYEMLTFELDGKTVYYVITDIEPMGVGQSEEV